MLETIIIKCKGCDTDFPALVTSKYDTLKLCESCINSSKYITHINRIASAGITPVGYLNGRPILKYDDVAKLYDQLNTNVVGKCVVCGSNAEAEFFDSRSDKHLRVAICRKCMSSNCDRIVVINDKTVIESAMPLSLYKEKATDLAYSTYALEYDSDIGD